MDFWNKLISRFSTTENKNKINNNELITKTNEAITDFECLWNKPNDFIEPQALDLLHNKWNPLFEALNTKTKSFSYKLGFSNQNIKTLSPKFFELYNRSKNKLHIHNENIARTRIDIIEQLITPVEGRRLDNQQLACIAKEVKSHLVLAGAGTGKTSTIIGYIKYLLANKKCAPNEILVLSFTNASATEMAQRIFSETGFKLDASTFHKLGINIITEVEGKRPIICTTDLRQFIKNNLPSILKDNSYFTNLCYYLTYAGNVQKSEFDFNTIEEYNHYLKSNPPITLKKEKVKSYGEMDIANFLYQHGIEYIYEKTYPFDTRTKEYSQYYPDFYLPQYDIYIEYYGINRHGLVPSYFSSKDGKNPSETYMESIRWKRNLHSKNNTKLIECYAYEKFEETLLDNLKQRLLDYNVSLSPKPPMEIWNAITANSNQTLDGVSELFATVITLIKSNNCSLDDIKSRNKSLKNLPSITLTLNLIAPLFELYQNHLQSHNEIDFNDMINNASRYVTENRYIHNYKYVIVDEYQDISQSRFRLLYLMRQQKDYSLFCVGDDWQSIYRFNGSDIGFILDFEKYWGAAEISKIETTYRFTQSLIDVSSSFIMKNPDQKKKSLRSAIEGTEFSVERITGINENVAINLLSDQLLNLPQNSSAILLGRYRFDINIIKASRYLTYHYDNSKKSVVVTHALRKDLKISFMTIHASKGLQADYVFILNNKCYGAGFPSKIVDAPILSLLLDNSDSFPEAEERRLFYVATTRAKKKVWLVTIEKNISEFVNEIEEAFGKQIKNTTLTCPKCGGKLVKRNGINGSFYGCSNYSTKGCHYTKNIK